MSVKVTSRDVADIGSADQLLSFAVAGQLERLRKRRGDLSQGKIALAGRLGTNSRTAGAALSHALSDGPTSEQLRRLDEIIGALSLSLKIEGVCGLSSLESRLVGGRTRAVMAQVPPGWTERLLRNDGPTEFEVLAQASALQASFMTAERMEPRSVSALRDRYEQEMEPLIRRLIYMSVSPPAAGNYDAQIMVGNLANFAFELMKDRLETAVRYSPLAFRVWRAISRMVQIRGDSDDRRDLMVWVRQLVRDSGSMRDHSLYPGACLDLELALAVPAAWSPPDGDWVGEALRVRARNPEATIRERGAAALGLWQRALEQDRDVDATARELRELIGELRGPDARPDAAAALGWLAATLDQVISRGEPVCNEWPDLDEPWLKRVHEAAGELDNFGVADHLRDGLKRLFLHMVLQPAAVYRRHATDTVVTSGLAAPASRALGLLIRNEREQTWVRIRAQAALGALQKPNQWVEADLARSALDSYQSIDSKPPGEWVPRADITEPHTCLFVIGDCFGAPEAGERAGNVRERIRPVLVDLAEAKGDRANLLRRPTRAAAYLLTVTAQPRKDGAVDLSEELLTKLAHHEDEVTARLSRWALSFRFASDGGIRPIIDAAIHGVDDTPDWALH